MEVSRPVIALLVTLIAVEGMSLNVGLPSPLSTIRSGILLGFLFGLPTLLMAGLLVIRQTWVVMAAVMYSTIGLALDLATIVQEASQVFPRSIIIALTLGSSLLNFLIMIFGGRCALNFGPAGRPPGGHHPNPQSPS